MSYVSGVVFSCSSFCARHLCNTQGTVIACQSCQAGFGRICAHRHQTDIYTWNEITPLSVHGSRAASLTELSNSLSLFAPNCLSNPKKGGSHTRTLLNTDLKSNHFSFIHSACFLLASFFHSHKHTHTQTISKLSILIHWWLIIGHHFPFYLILTIVKLYKKDTFSGSK